MSYWTGDPISVGDVEQLLIDDYMVEDAWGLERRVCPPLRHPANPMITTDRPWEHGSIGSSVFYNEEAGLYRMLYGAYNAVSGLHQSVPTLREQWRREVHGCPYNLCCAESRDGFLWTKPDLDLHPWRSHAHTNIVFTGRTRCCGGVIENPDRSDPQKRYILLYIDRETLDAPAFRRVAFSPDGLHWAEDDAYPPVRGARDGADRLCWDPGASLWFRYLRPPMLAADKSIPSAAAPRNIKRRMCVMTSPDLKEWTFPRCVLYPDELDPTPNSMDSWTVFKRGSHFVCLFTEMNESDEGRCAVRIASSADGFHWTRIPGRPFFFQGGLRQGDAPGYLGAPSRPVEIGDKWVMYMRGSPRGQCAQGHGVGFVAALVLPQGKLVGRWAGDEGGFLLTREIGISGRFLEINCESIVSDLYDDSRIIRVGVAKRRHGPTAQTADGYYEGFSLEDCDPIVQTTMSDRRVTWKGGADLGALKGKPAYLRFYLRNTGLYSFRFVDA